VHNREKDDLAGEIINKKYDYPMSTEKLICLCHSLLGGYEKALYASFSKQARLSPSPAKAFGNTEAAKNFPSWCRTAAQTTDAHFGK
jgi:hypothetical protein